MYTKITQSVWRRYLQLVEGFRDEGGKVRHRVVANLGRIEDLTLQKLGPLINGLNRVMGRASNTSSEVISESARAYSTMDGSSKTRKSPPRDAVSKVALQRMSVLELARALGNVADACRQRDRTSFYEWKRRFQTHAPQRNQLLICFAVELGGLRPARDLR